MSDLPDFPVTDPVCSTLGCENPATWQPIVVFRPPRPMEGEADCILRLGVCEECKAGGTLDDVLSDDGFERIRAEMVKLGYVPPDRSRSTLSWRRIGAQA